MPSTADRPTSNQPDVFVSHASANRDGVMPVVEALGRVGVAVWFDQRGIAGGENYTREIAGANEGAAAVVPWGDAP